MTTRRKSPVPLEDSRPLAGQRAAADRGAAGAPAVGRRGKGGSPPAPTSAAGSTPRRTPLTRERALQAALGIADAGGLEALTMRRLAEALEVEAMSLYHHVENKTAILDGMVDLVFAEVELPPADLDWRAALRRRMVSLREALVRHRWALAVLESRSNPGPATLAQHDAVLGCLLRGGFGLALAGHAFAALDSYVFGFVHTELTLPFETSEETLAVARDIFEKLPPGAFPHLTEFTLGHVLKPGYAFRNEFPFGLDLLLDGLERARAAEAAPPPQGAGGTSAPSR